MYNFLSTELGEKIDSQLESKCLFTSGFSFYNKKSRICGTSDLSALLKSASNVQIGLKCTYLWGRFSLKCTESASNVQRENSVHLKPILCTFEADSLYIWGRFSIHLRQILYTYRSCSLIGSEASHEKINYLCLKCTDWPQMYRESASNV